MNKDFAYDDLMSLCLQQSEEDQREGWLSYTWRGRSVATMKQYGGAYRKWNRFLKQWRRVTCGATGELVCSYLIENGEGEGAVSQFLVMIGFLSELQGHKSCTKSQMVGQVSKAVVKRMTSRKKRKMILSMKKLDMKKFMRALFKE